MLLLIYIYMYINELHFYMLILDAVTLLNSLLSSSRGFFWWIFWDFIHRLLCHLLAETVSYIHFQFACFYFYSFSTCCRGKISQHYIEEEW